MFERGALATGGLPFAELKRAFSSTPREAADATLPDFSRLICIGCQASESQTQVELCQCQPFLWADVRSARLA